MRQVPHLSGFNNNLQFASSGQPQLALQLSKFLLLRSALEEEDCRQSKASQKGRARWYQ